MSFDRRKPADVESLVSVKIDNLSYRTSTDQLKRAFEKFGEIGDVYIPRDPYGHEASRGFGFVRYYDSRDADDAVHAMDGISLNGREIRVQLARHNRSHRADFVAPSRGNRRNYSRRSRSRSRSHSRPRRRRSRSSSRDRYRRRSRSRSRDKKAKSRSGDSRKRDLSRSKSRSAKRHKGEENGNDRKQEEVVTDASEQDLRLTDVEYAVGDVECVKSDHEGVKSDLEGVKDDLESVKDDLECVKSDLEGVKNDLEGDVGYNLEHPSALNEEESAQEDGDNNNNYQQEESVTDDNAVVEDSAVREVAELKDRQNESENNSGDVERDGNETDEEFKPDDQVELASVQNCEDRNLDSGARQENDEDDDDDNDTIDNTSENGGFVDGDGYSGNTDEDSLSRDVGHENSCDKKEEEEDSEDGCNNGADKCDDN